VAKGKYVMNRLYITVLVLMSICFLKYSADIYDPFSQKEGTEIIHNVNTREDVKNRKFSKQTNSVDRLQYLRFNYAGFAIKKAVRIPPLLYRKLICVYLI
jgi:hypothetical protein